MKKVFFYSLAVLTLWACKNDSAKQWNDLDLLPYGIPITIQAPDSADVNVSNLGVMKDITIKKGDDFNIQIFGSPVTSESIEELLSNQLDAVKTNRFFSKIMNEGTTGFVYETVIDSNNINYGFRHVHYQGDMEYVFQQSLIGTFSLEQIEKMYGAVRQDNK